MILLIVAMLLVLGIAGFLVPDTLVGAVMQIVLIGALVALGLKRIRAVSSQIRRFEVD